MKKTVKKVLLLTVIIALFFVIFCFGVSAEKDGYYTFVLKDEGAIVTDVDESIKGDVVIPDTLGGFPVTKIGTNAFWGCENIDTVIIPNSVTEIAYSAFQRCRGLIDVVIPESVIKIGYGAFMECINLERIVIPNSVTQISESAFAGCKKLTNVIIPDSVIEIGESAFSDCESLKSITLPFIGDKQRNPQNIHFGVIFGAEDCFSNNKFIPKNLEEVIITAPCKKIYSYAFYGCTELTSVTIPNSIIQIGSSAFEGCTNLTGISIPKSVTKIGSSAFVNCCKFTSITIPDSVVEIGNDVFEGCTSLTSITIPFVGNTKDDINSRFGNFFGGYYSSGVFIFDIPKSLKEVIITQPCKEISYYAFADCEGITRFTIADSVEKIDRNAFVNTGYYNNTSNWKNGVLYISNHLIKAKDENVSVNIRQGTKTIADGAFDDCVRLKNITIPSSIKFIGIEAFKNTNIENVFYGGNSTQRQKIKFYGEYWQLGNASWHYQATDHSYGSYKTISKATCASVGLKQRICSVCKHVDEVVIAKKSHTYTTSTTKATLSKDGKITEKCKSCSAKKNTPIYKIKSVKLSSSTIAYTGKTLTPSVTVKDSKGKTLKNKTDYTVSYPEKRKSIGKYTVTVTFKGKYSGTKKLSFTIKPATVTLSKVTAGSKQLTANWKTVAAVTGYEVQASTSSKFTSKTTKKVTVKSAKTKKTTIKKLKKGKKYYVKVRAYKTVDGKKIYGAWSAVKSIKVK